MIVAVKTTVVEGLHSLRAFAASGSLLWAVDTQFVLPRTPSHVPLYQPVLVGSAGSPRQRVYFAGAPGKLLWRDNLDAAVALSSGSVDCGEGAVNSALVTNDAAVFFTTADAIVRVDAASHAVVARKAVELAGPTYKHFPSQFAPAFALDGSLMYVLVGDRNLGSKALLMAVDPVSLSVVSKSVPIDPRTADVSCVVFDVSSASPTVGPDGDVFLGMITQAAAGLPRSSGWLLHWDKHLTQQKLPGASGWDDTVTIVATSAAQSVSCAQYLLFAKLNDYASGRHRLVLMDPFVRDRILLAARCM